MRIIRIVLLTIFLFFAGAAISAWWIVYRALPKTTGALSLDGLSQLVTVERNSLGVPHIRAGSLADLVEAQGYVTAQDRLWQMDVLRRLGAGELSEIFGPHALDIDRQFRRLGLRHVAEREASALDPERREVLEAYARGVNHFIAEHNRSMPAEFFLLRYKPKPWTPADSLLIGGYMYELLTLTWPKEINRETVSLRVGPERAAEMFAEDSPDDRVVVGDEATSPSRPAMAPAHKAGKPSAAISNTDPEAAADIPIRGNADLWDQARAILASFAEESRASIGSNNWAVDGSHTASGKPLLANDTHLELTMPSIWYIVHLTAPGWNVAGFSLPGEPLVVIGHNDRIAWGFSNNGADVQDLYLERFSDTNPHRYLANGKFVDAEVVTERIKVRGQADTSIDVISTRHGPIVRQDNGRMYALKWMALEPGALSHGYMWMGRAQSWREFRESLRDVSGPAQNVVYADVDGNIGFIVPGWIPIRKSGHGEVPVPGDTDEFEWGGYIPFDELPQVLNPPSGIIVTANARVVGPGYKHYITDRWESPYRTERIFDLLKDRKDLRPADMNAIQNDIVALNDKRLGDELVHTAASASAKPRDARTGEIIARLAKWDGRATVDSVETSFVEVTRDAFVRNLLEPYLSTSTDLYQWRGSVLVDQILRERPQDWLPPGFHTFDEMLVASEDQATAMLDANTHSKNISDWEIGKLNRLTMDHPLGQSGILHFLLSIGPIEQSGSAYAPKAMTHTHGPAMRFVADTSNWDQSMMEINSGESGEFGSAHYKDQFADWFAGRGIAAAFSVAAEAQTHGNRLTLAPSGKR